MAADDARADDAARGVARVAVGAARDLLRADAIAHRAALAAELELRGFGGPVGARGDDDLGEGVGVRLELDGELDGLPATDDDVGQARRLVEVVGDAQRVGAGRKFDLETAVEVGEGAATADDLDGAFDDRFLRRGVAHEADDAAAPDAPDVAGIIHHLRARESRRARDALAALALGSGF